jgi:hypothetical protein
MADSDPQPTHKLDYILLVAGQQVLVLKPLDENASPAYVMIDEVLASHLIGVQDLEIRAG